MPADRSRSSRRNNALGHDAPYVLASPWTDSANTPAPVGASSKAPPEGVPSRTRPILFEQEMHPLPKTKNNRRKSENHIPRPPNAFILFRSSFIKSRHVTTEVETNHSTLSKIIGLTWQNLPEAERQKWHAEAKIAQEEHKRQFPQYSFRPIHSKARGAAAERRKFREVGPKDQKRCAKIAELLVGGKKGQELEIAIQEFDKHHVPEIVTRFEIPITANTYSSSKSERRSSSPVSLRKICPMHSSPRARKASAAPSPSPQDIVPPQDAQHMPPIHSMDTHSFDLLDQNPSFGPNSFAFTITQPSPSAASFMEDHYTGDPNNTAMHAFEPQALQDTGHLCPNPQYPSYLDDSWPRHGSPLSNSTSSMPTTPAQICVPFPESYSPSAFNVNGAIPNYATLDGSYCDFSQYPAPFASISEMTGTSYGVGAKESEHLSSGFHVHDEGVNSSQLQVHQDPAFSLYMQTASHPINYSL